CSWVLSCAFMGAESHRLLAAASVELPSPLRVFDALADPERSRFGPAAEAKLGENAGYVVLRGPGADHEALGDLGVGATFGQEIEHLVLSAGKARGPSRPGAAGRGAQLSQKAGR